MMPLLPPNARTHSGEGETVDDRLQQVQMPPSIPSPSEALLKASRRLDSWKEIAAYLRRDIKTARRWEKREGLPVRRHHHGRISSVYASVEDIDAWRDLRNAPVSKPLHRRRLPRVLIGRQRELDALRHALERALDGQRQLVFVHGELGIGKSALLAAFLGGLDERVWVTEAHSIECCGPPEPCVPIIEALTTLAHSDDNRVISAIECAAPSWADRVLRSVARRSARNGATGGTREPLPRELCAAVEMLARITPLVIAFDDLHWADDATFDVLARLAKHRDRLSLMIVGTFRREMCTASRSGLGRLYNDLRAHFECTDIELSQLDGGGVSQYLDTHGHWAEPEGAAKWFLDRSGGNPLFLAHLLSHAVDTGQVFTQNGCRVLNQSVSHDAVVPPTLHGLIDMQLSVLDDDSRAALAIASVVGQRFAAAAIADATAQPLPRIEQLLQRLVQRGEFITRCAPVIAADGSISAGYAFVHTLYRNVLNHGIAAGTRARLEEQLRRHTR